MAELDDLDELCLNDEEDALSAKFSKAASCIQSRASKLDNDTLLSLYGYYKQATEGACNTSKPSWYDMKAKTKWEAWHKLGEMSQQNAKQAYIKLVDKIEPGFSEENKTTEGWIRVSAFRNDDLELSSADKSLFDYVKEGNMEKVKTILSTSIKSVLNSADDDGMTVLHWAADRGSKEILETLLAHGADVNVTDSENQTPLHYAASCGHLDCVKVLLQHGANAKIQDNEGNTPLSVASDNDVVKLLET